MYDYFYGIQAEQFSFYRVPKILFTDRRFRKMSMDARILYGILLDRMNLSAKNGWLDEDGRVYIIYTLDECMEDLGCANEKATRLFRELDQTYGLIERKRQGMGKPNLIYVKNFASNREKQGQMQNHENRESRVTEIVNQESRKSNTNNTNINKTDKSDTDTFFLEGEEDCYQKEIWTYPAVRSFFFERLEIINMIHDLPEEEESILGILELIVDTYCSKKDVIRVAGEDKPVEIVRSQLMKLRREHIQYVLLCLKENTTKIWGIKQYLLTMLYNAPMMIQPYYQARVNYELYGGE